MSDQGEVVELDRARGFRLIRRHMLVVVLIAVVLAAIGVLYGIHSRNYKATSSVRVAKPLALSLAGSTRTTTDDARAVTNETEILSSSEMERQVERSLGVTHLSVAVAPIDNSDIVDITVTADKRSKASEQANAFAEAYVSMRTNEIQEQIDTALAQLGKQVTAAQARLRALNNRTADNVPTMRSILSSQIEALQSQELNYQQAEQVGYSFPSVAVEATRPTGSSLREPIEYGVIGLALGILLGLLIATELETVRGRVKDMSDVSRAAAGTRTRVIALPRSSRGRRRSAYAASIRSVTRALLMVDEAADTGQSAHREAPTFCGLVAADGRSNSALLAEVRDQAAMWGARVAVVTARFDLPDRRSGGATLSDILDGRTSGDQQAEMARLDDGGGVVIAGGDGSICGDAALGSNVMVELLRSLAETHDRVVVDLSNVETALLLANAMNETLYCVLTLAPSARSPRDVERQIDELSLWRSVVVAAVLRRSARKSSERNAGLPLLRRSGAADGSAGDQLPPSSGSPDETPGDFPFDSAGHR